MRDLIVSFVMIIGGTALVFIPTNIGISILGCCFAVLGLILVFTLKSHHKDIESGIKYNLKIKYYHARRKDEILKALAERADILDWTEEENSEGLRLDIYYNCAANKVFARCYKYIPYEYQACSDWFCLDMDKCGNLTK